MMHWNATKDEYKLIAKIVTRAVQKYHDMDIPLDIQSLTMDLTACHSNGCPLDFQRLLDAPDFDFCHDIGGIQRHINRTTGEIEDCFLPRTAAPQHQPA